MLTHLGLKNFKLFADEGVSLDFGKVTLLIGPNASGKSTILQALLLLKQSIDQGSLQPTGPYWNFGGYREIVHCQDPDRAMRIDIAVDYDGFGPWPGMDPEVPSAGTLTQNLSLTENTVRGSTGTLRSDRGIVSCDWRDGEKTRSVPLVVPEAGRLVLSGRPEIAAPIRFVIEQHETFDRREQQRLQVDLGTVLGSIRSQLQKTVVVPAMRGLDDRAYVAVGPVAADTLNAVGSPLDRAGRVANVLASEPDFGEVVAGHLRSVAPGNYLRARAHLVSKTLIAAELTRPGASTNLVDEAFGLNQLVPLLVYVLKAESGSVVGIEEPEAHLHPRAQAMLCDVLLGIATERKQQLVLTTHSEHVAMALLTAVARGSLKPEELAIYEFRREGDAATADRLNVTEHGQVEGGLRTFFEVDIDQLGDFIAARLSGTRG